MVILSNLPSLLAKVLIHVYLGIYYMYATSLTYILQDNMNFRISGTVTVGLTSSSSHSHTYNLNNDTELRSNKPTTMYFKAPFSKFANSIIIIVTTYTTGIMYLLNTNFLPTFLS
jgi:hypothetical protein